MRRFIVTACLTALFFSSATAHEPRDASAILRDHEAAKSPVFDTSKNKDIAYIRSHSEQRRRALERQGELARELYRTHPQHEQAIKLLLANWTQRRGQQSGEAVREMNNFLKDHSDSPAKHDVLYTRALAAVMASYPDDRKQDGDYVD